MENLIGCCVGCKYNKPQGDEMCNECCRNPRLSDNYEEGKNEDVQAM